MGEHHPEHARQRAAVLVGRFADARETRANLAALEIECELCASAESFVEHAHDAGVLLLIADAESLDARTLDALRNALAEQSAWSDVPLIVFTSRRAPGGEIARLRRFGGNLTLLERPVRVDTFLAAVRAAARARHRQWESRKLLEDVRQANLVKDDLVRQLELSDRRKGDFLAMLGHELRNPLAAISGAIAVTRTPGVDAARAQKFYEIIARQSAQLARMVDDLLDVSRIARGKLTLEREPSDLADIVQRCIRAVEPQVSAHGLTLRFEQSDAPVVASVDPLRIEQVVTNLLTNAIKYTPRGGHVCARVSSDGDEALIEVVDDGVGLAPNIVDTIFEPFTQVHSSVARSDGGLGLGLHVVRRVVDMHGGTVKAESRGPGRGARFMVRLPTMRASARAAAPVAQEHPAGAPRRVLVVEDNDDVREALGTVLRTHGYEVEVAIDGLTGVDRAITTWPDVAIVDIGLPQLDGYELARRVREAERDHAHKSRLIALTGYGQPEDRSRALQAGFDAHIVKPVELPVLLRMIEERPPA